MAPYSVVDFIGRPLGFADKPSPFRKRSRICKPHPICANWVSHYRFGFEYLLGQYLENTCMPIAINPYPRLVMGITTRWGVPPLGFQKNLERIMSDLVRHAAHSTRIMARLFALAGIPSTTNTRLPRSSIATSPSEVRADHILGRSEIMRASAYLNLVRFT